MPHLTQITAAMKGLGKRRKELSKEEFAAAKEALQAELAPSLEEKVRLEAAVPALTKELEQVRRQRKKELGKMGNFLDESVPVSNDEVCAVAAGGGWYRCPMPSLTWVCATGEAQRRGGGVGHPTQGGGLVEAL